MESRNIPEGLLVLIYILHVIRSEQKGLVLLGLLSMFQHMTSSPLETEYV